EHDRPSGPAGHRVGALQHGGRRYTARPRIGQKLASIKYQGIAMTRFAISVVLVVVVLIGGLFLLAGRATEQPQTRVEKAVTLANLS
ncbi:MAG TPA: hypothetical protein VF638_02470, partial [Sphingomonas sp.]